MAVFEYGIISVTVHDIIEDSVWIRGRYIPLLIDEIVTSGAVCEAVCTFGVVLGGDCNITEDSLCAGAVWCMDGANLIEGYCGCDNPWCDNTCGSGLVNDVCGACDGVGVEEACECTDTSGLNEEG